MRKKEIYSYPGYYVLEDGTVIGKRGKPIHGHVDRCGYREVVLSYYPNKQKQVLVHRLVLSTFNPVPNMDNLFVNHKDGNKLNNNISNLEWCTRSENTKHSYMNGLQKIATNPHGTYDVLKKDKLDKIRELHLAGMTDMNVAKEIGCSRSLVSRKIREWGIR